jgi:hypothetical protein
VSSSFDLFGIPEKPTINNLFPPLGIQFSQLLGDTFAPNGSGGAPDAATDPMGAYTYLTNKVNLITASAQQRPMIRIADKNLNIVGELVGEVSCDTEELMSDTGTATVTCAMSNWLLDFMANQIRIDEDVHLIIDPVPTQRTWRTRWGGKVHQINLSRNDNGSETAQITALSHREHAKKLLIAANPFFPPEVQLPRMWVLPGPVRTILFATFFINLARLFVPGLSLITNIFNPASWINPLNTGGLFNFDPLAWPIQVAFVNPLLDQSRWTAIGATWTSWHDATTDMLKDCGIVMRAYTWLDEDEDSPYTELTEIITGIGGIGGFDLLSLLGLQTADQLVQTASSGVVDVLTRPKRNCVVFALEDMSGQTGPTGTALDGLLNLIGVTTDDLFTSILVNADTGQTLDGEPVIDVINPTTPIAQSLLGVAPAPPKVIWRGTQFDHSLSKTHSLYKAPPRTMMTGGRSPAIVNQLQTFGIKWALSQIQMVFTGGVFAEVGPSPIGSGLEELYQGQLDNVLLAWERITNVERALWTGDLAYQEYFERGSQTAYTLSGILTLRQADWNTRARYGFQAQVVSGYPWVLDVDVRLGERAGWEFNDVIFVDEITAIRRHWDRHKPVTCDLSVGDDKDKQDPIARGMRAINAMYGLFGALLGEATIFG